MTTKPILEEVARASAGRRPEFADWSVPVIVQADRHPRRLSIYGAEAGFELIGELEFLCNRTVEPNVFFSPAFLAPAMPRVEDREVSLAVVRDGVEGSDRVRLLLPFTVQAPPGGVGPAIMRTWAHAFGLLGTPLLDRDDAAAVLGDLLAMIGRARLKLPKVLVLPDIKLDGAFAGLLPGTGLKSGPGQTKRLSVAMLIHERCASRPKCSRTRCGSSTAGAPGSGGTVVIGATTTSSPSARSTRTTTGRSFTPSL